jgi:amino-acid N-acetyltransferase
MITYSQAKKEDLPEIIELLAESTLPSVDVHHHIDNFIVAKKGKRIVGAIGIERYENEGLLRSFVVADNERNGSIGKKLYSNLASFSKENNVSRLHLLTTTAEGYFKRLGFEVVERSNAPEAIRNTMEFSSLCPSSSTYMVKSI